MRGGRGLVLPLLPVARFSLPLHTTVSFHLLRITRSSQPPPFPSRPVPFRSDPVSIKNSSSPNSPIHLTMVKLILTLIPALSLFLLFPLSDSLPTTDPVGGDVLLLPSDIPRAVPDTDSPATVADPMSAIAEPEHEPEGFVTVPLTKIDFHEGSMPLALRFPHRRRFGRGCRHGFMCRQRMRPREIPYGNDMILSNGKDRAEGFVGRSRFHWVNRRPRFEVDAPWKGEEDVFQRPKKLERGFNEEDLFMRPKKFRRHDEDDDVFTRLKKFDRDDEDHMFEHESFRTPRKFMHPDDEDDWHREKHRHRHHHKHHHDDDDDDEEDRAHEHGKHRHHDDDGDDKSGILSKMRKFFDDLF